MKLLKNLRSLLNHKSKRSYPLWIDILVASILAFVLIGGLAYFLLQPKVVSAAWYDDSWKYRETITIDHTKISGDSSLTNFPLLISLTDTSLKHAQSSGNDILFTSADGATKLDHEIEKFDYDTNTLVVWVEIPTLSVTDDIVIYMYYGNATATSQQTPTGVWGNYGAVWHLSENPAGTPPQMLDSTSNNTDGTSGGSMTAGDQVTGKINGSLDFDGSDDNINTGDPSFLDGATQATWSFWLKPNNRVGYDGILKKWGSSQNQFLIRSGNGSVIDEIEVAVANSLSDNTAYGERTSNADLVLGNWYYITIIYDGTQAAADDRLKIYVNGSLTTTTLLSTGAPTSIPSGSTANLLIASDGALYNGIMDEVRIATTAETAGWAITEYNNQNAPTTFYKIGTEEKSKDPMLYWKLDAQNVASTTAVDTSSASAATGYSFQRKTWYDGTRYWVAFHSLADARIEFWYSTGGTTWTENTGARISADTNDFSIEADSSNAFIAYVNTTEGDGYDVVARSAASYPNTNFTWSAATTVYNGTGATDKYYYPVITRDSSNNVWIATSSYTNSVSTTFYAGSSASYDGDGEIGYDNTTWAATHDATDGNIFNDTNATFRVLSQEADWTIGYFIYRDFIPIDTSSLPDSATITAATLNITTSTTAKTNGDNDGEDFITVVQGSQAATDSLSNADFDQAGSTEGIDVAQRKDISGMSTSQKQSFTLNSTGLGWISTTGATKFAIREGHDFLNSPIADNLMNRVFFYASEQTGTSQDPSLDVTYTDNLPYRQKAVKSSSANSVSSWGSISILDSSNNSNKYGTIVSIGSGNMYAAWIDNTTIEGAKYASSTWGSTATIDTGVTGLTNNMSAVADSSNNVHLAYINASNQVAYKKYNGTAWDSTALILDSNSGNTSPTLSIDSSNNMYLYWLRSNTIFLKQYVSSYWQNTVDWYSSGTNAYLSANYSGTNHFAIWTNGSANPYNIMFGLISSPLKENMAYDSSGNSNNGRVNGPAWQEKGLCVNGECLKFDGSNDYVLKNYNQDTELDFKSGSFAISLWFKHPTTVSGTDTILSRFNAAGYKIYMQSNGTVCFGIDDDASSFPEDFACSTTSFADAQWHHLEAVKSSTTSITLYIDGNQVGQDIDILAGNSLSGTAPTLYLGVDNDGSSNPWDGFIDEVKLYGYLRTAAQVSADYSAQGSILGVSARMGSQTDSALTKGLIGYWKMDESSSDAADSSGSGINLTNNSTMAFAVGEFGNAVQCDGTADYLNTATAMSGIKTVSFWVYPAAATDNYFINLINSSAYITVNSSGVVSATGFTSPSIYINGVLNGTVSAAAWSLITITSDTGINANAFSVGLTNDGSNHFCTNNSKIDDVRVYNRTLSSRDVSDLNNWAPGPIGYWNFEEGTGSTAYDASGNSYNGTITGATYQTGKFGKALNFNGSTDAVASIPSIAGINTVSFWVYPTSTTANLVDLQTSPGTINISASSGTISATGFTSPTYYINGLQTTSPTLTANVWQHIEITTTTAITGSAVRFGRISTTSMTGKLDDIKFYNYVRSSKQVVEDMNASHPAPGSPVGSATAYWRFDEGIGTIVYDSSNNDHTIDQGVGSIRKTPNGKFGAAFDGDGTNYYFRNDDSALDFTSIDDFTISFWVKSDSATNPSTNNQSALAKENGAGYEFYFEQNTGILYFGIDDDATFNPDQSVNSVSDIYDNSWHHVAVVKQGTTRMDMYIDGVLKNSLTSVTVGDMSNSAAFYVGSGKYDKVLGDIDELKVYRSALTADQIKLDYNQGKSLVLGTLSDSSSYAQQSKSQEYCVPGENVTCGAPRVEYLFDEKTGITAYSTGSYPNTSSLQNSPTWTKGKFGSGLTFNGTNQSVTGWDLDFATGPFSITAWFKTTTIADGQRIIAKWNSVTNINYEIYTNTSACGAGILGITAGLYDGVTWQEPTDCRTNYADGKWHHAALVVTTSQILVYVDGILGNTDTHDNSIPNSNTNFLIGTCGAPCGGGYFPGSIDQVRIFDYALSAAQVSKDFNQGKPAGWWKFDECQGTTAYDSSSNGNNATIYPVAGTQSAVGTCTTSATTMWYNGRNGKYNSSLNFDGSDDYVATSNVALIAANTLTTTKVSWGAWVKPATGVASKTIVHKNNEFKLTTDGNSKANCAIYSGSWQTAAVSTTTIPLSSWTNILCTYDGTNIKTYVNGQLEATQSQTNSITSINTSAVNIGRDSAGSGYFEGQIDDVRIYNYTLSAVQAKEVHNQSAVRFGPITGIPL